jgi:hypothetical protein
MKTSMLMKIVAAVAIGAAFPLGTIAAQPAKTTTERRYRMVSNRLPDRLTADVAEGDLEKSLSPSISKR